jgi:hypothetical protein
MKSAVSLVPLMYLVMPPAPAPIPESANVDGDDGFLHVLAAHAAEAAHADLEQGEVFLGGGVCEKR